MDNAKRSKYSKGKGEEDFLKDKDWGEQKKDIPGNITMKDSGQTEFYRCKQQKPTIDN